MDTSYCRERIERLLVGRTGIIVKVIHNVADTVYLRPIVLKLNIDHDECISMLFVGACFFCESRSIRHTTIYFSKKIY